MFGFICAIISGISMSIQGVFNTRVSEKMGTYETNVLVHGTALILTLLLVFFLGKGNFKAVKDVNKFYLLGGVLGVVITITVMKSISSLGTTVGIGTILISQLAAAAIINAFGLFGSERIKFGLNEIIGLALMFAGIVILKWEF